MSYVGNNGSIFNRSKKSAKEIISTMENGDDFIIVVTSDSVLKTTNRESAIRIIDELEINLSSETTIKKLVSAVSFLISSSNINKEIFLFSDFQSTTFENKNQIDSLLNMQDESIRLYSFDMSISNSNNYSVSNLQLESSIIELNRPLSFSALISNYSSNAIENLTASLYLNDVRVAQQ